MRGDKPALSSGRSTEKTVEAIAMGFPAPPADLDLRGQELVFWDRIVRARMPQQWVDFDLVHAANLARTWADMETERNALSLEGTLIRGSQGQYVNPRHKVIEMLSKRALMLTRVLQLHAVVQVGQADENVQSKTEAAHVGHVLTSPKREDDFLARPPTH